MDRNYSLVEAAQEGPNTQTPGWRTCWLSGAHATTPAP